MLGPLVLLVGAVGIATAWVLPFAYGDGSAFYSGTVADDGTLTAGTRQSALGSYRLSGARPCAAGPRSCSAVVRCC